MGEGVLSLLEDVDGCEGTPSPLSCSFPEEEFEALRARTTGEQKVVAGTQRAVLRGTRDGNECRRGSGRADALQRAWMITRDMVGFENTRLCSSYVCSNHLGSVLSNTNRTGAFVSSRERGFVCTEFLSFLRAP